MNDQPNVPLLDFDVTTMVVTREGEPVYTPGWNVTHIVDRRESFELQIRFKISGPIWDNIIVPAAGGLQNIEAKFEVAADCIGGPDVKLGTATKSLTDLAKSGTTYTYKHIVPKNTINIDGVYEVAAVVSMQNKTTGSPYTGMLGFSEGLKILVHEREDTVEPGQTLTP